MSVWTDSVTTADRHDPQYYERLNMVWLAEFDKRFSSQLRKTENRIVAKLGVWLALHLAIGVILLTR